MHNKSIRYKRTLEENKYLLNEFVNFCGERNISVFLVVAPMSKYYSSGLDKSFKKVFYDVLNSLDGIVHLLDFNEDALDVFGDNDFNDADHLNDIGAEKLTRIILAEIGENV